MTKRQLLPFGGLLTAIERFLFGSVALSVYLASLISPGFGPTTGLAATFGAIVALLIITAPTRVQKLTASG